MPVTAHGIRDRRPNLLGQICSGRVRKLAGSPTKAAGRAVERQLYGKAEFGIGRFGIQKRQVFKIKASTAAMVSSASKAPTTDIAIPGCSPDNQVSNGNSHPRSSCHSVLRLGRFSA
jgi:hypothetical protein